jgi:hypothetical protein
MKMSRQKSTSSLPEAIAAAKVALDQAGHHAADAIVDPMDLGVLLDVAVEAQRGAAQQPAAPAAGLESASRGGNWVFRILDPFTLAIIAAKLLDGLDDNPQYAADVEATLEEITKVAAGCVGIGVWLKMLIEVARPKPAG